MTVMRKVLSLSLVVLAACGLSAGPTTTTGATLQTVAPVTTTTTLGSQPFEVHGCSAPPVTFSALCEVYELVQEWHVDRPADSAALADVATRALREFSGNETQPPPRTLFCAVPHEDFIEFCEELARIVYESGTAIGPAVDAAVTAMTDLGLDPFTYYVPPEQVGAFRVNGVVGGVGILLDATNAVGSRCAAVGETCPLQIVFVLEDNPGAAAGLKAGDTIIAVDGEPVDGQGFVAAGSSIAGDESGMVQITVERDGETLVFDVERAELVIPTVEVDVPISDVGYLRIPDFEHDIPGLVRAGLTSLLEFRPATIVIDLRDNPGGFIHSAVDVASEFISGGLVMETFGPDEHLEYAASEGGLATSQRLVVLVNQGTASAAEVLAGALRDRRGAVIVGTNTFGKDAVQIPFNLRNGGELYVAVARWATPSGLTAGSGGLTPDRKLELTADMTMEEVVSAALDVAS